MTADGGSVLAWDTMHKDRIRLGLRSTVYAIEC
jgi:hypothetical protein